MLCDAIESTTPVGSAQLPVAQSKRQKTSHRDVVIPSTQSCGFGLAIPFTRNEPSTVRDDAHEH